ncbi:hypothetical protein GO013_02070 [Pseudodesulfovibrio sp. JC047]|uniref:LutC/YkgG family protein n=1 Tax=Pseudodesulfovibrio sp. JC047 TaxID=2683199 RepID=UPI0013D6ADBE|nr:LUD domain-containing protein [Pseudodesulfovibrio sp. JC047]NDV18204.1 hypothetical protein [Pseudodesulfovibrio sp. JC047]
MASNARTAILSRLRAGKNSAYPEPVEPWFPESEKGKRSHAEVVDEFAERMEATWSTVLRCSLKDVIPTVRAVLQDHSLENLIQAPTTWIGQKIAEEWGDDDAELLYWDNENPDSKDILFATAKASITSVKAGIADEAAVLLWPDKVEPRLLSLVPPVYIAAVRTSEIYPSFSAAVEKFDWVERRPRNAVLISGPSKSADIENTLRVGIHGPVKLIVLIVDDSAV